MIASSCRARARSSACATTQSARAASARSTSVGRSRRRQGRLVGQRLGQELGVEQTRPLLGVSNGSSALGRDGPSAASFAGVLLLALNETGMISRSRARVAAT